MMTENLINTEEKNEILKKYEFIVNSYSEYMSLINRDYVYEAVNNSYCKAYGRKREDIVGKHICEIWEKDICESRIKPYLDKCFRGESARIETSFEFTKGVRKYFQVNYFPYTAKNGEITHAVVVTEDITQRKIAENALLRSEQNLREIVEQKEKYLKRIEEDL